MKHFFYLLASVLILASCKTIRNTTKSSDPNHPVYAIVEKLNKQPTNAKAIKALPVAYAQSQAMHLKNIQALQNLNSIDNGEKIVSEYLQLQNLFVAIVNSPAASLLVKATNYQNDIINTQQQFAEIFYQLGLKSIASANRADQLKALTTFKRILHFDDNYKDSKSNMEDAYKASFVNIVVNPLINNPSSAGGNFESIICKDLESRNKDNYPAKYFTLVQSEQQNIVADWMVYVTVSNLDMAAPVISTTSTNFTNKVANGKDTLGRTIYETVYGTVINEKATYGVKARISINILEAKTGKNIYDSSYSDSYSNTWNTRSYSGDPRSGDKGVLPVPGSISTPGPDQMIAAIKTRLPAEVERHILNAVTN
jgi:hypothetical protein